MGRERLAKRANPFVRAVARPHRELANGVVPDVLHVANLLDHERAWEDRQPGYFGTSTRGRVMGS